MEHKYICHSLNELHEIAGMLLGQYPDDRIFALKGQLGAGKTTFIKEMCKLIGVQSKVVSPTFAIINEYFSNLHGPVYHFDFYRIEKAEEVMDMGYEEYFYSENFCLIEWPEKIEKLLPGNIVYVTIVNLDDESRSIHFKKK